MRIKTLFMSILSLVALVALTGCAAATPTPVTEPAAATPTTEEAVDTPPTQEAVDTPPTQEAVDAPPTQEATAAPTEEAKPMQAEVVMQNIAFQPGEITVQPGTTVTWTNQDSFAHTVTAGTRGNPSGLFDSGKVGAGETFSFTFNEPGTYEYFCSIHSGMNGTVIVEEGAAGQQGQAQEKPATAEPAGGATGSNEGGGGGY